MTRYMDTTGTAIVTATGTPLAQKLFGHFNFLNIPLLQLIDLPAHLCARDQGLSTGRAAAGNPQLAGGFWFFWRRGKGVRGNVSPAAPELQFFMGLFSGLFKTAFFKKNRSFPQVNPQKSRGLFKISDFKYSDFLGVSSRFWAPAGLFPGRVSAPAVGRW